jgi:hypothetical protein
MLDMSVKEILLMFRAQRKVCDDLLELLEMTGDSPKHRGMLEAKIEQLDGVIYEGSRLLKEGRSVKVIDLIGD